MANYPFSAHIRKLSVPHISGFFIGALILVGMYSVQAWTGPTATAPGGNVSGILDGSATAQSKIGGLLLNTGGATNGLIVQNGFVGIGTTNPTQKLSVNGYIGATGIVYPDGTVQTTAYAAAPTAYLYSGAHTTVQCGNIGSVVGVSGNTYCRVTGSSCPSGWTYMGYNSTSPATCSGDGRDGTTCTTSSHSWSTAGLESCTYNTTYPTSSSRTCTDSYSEVGCY